MGERRGAKSIEEALQDGFESAVELRREAAAADDQEGVSRGRAVQYAFEEVAREAGVELTTPPVDKEKMDDIKAKTGSGVITEIT